MSGHVASSGGPHRRFIVADVRPENYRTVTLVMRESLESQPGQFVMAWLPDVDERPYSIAGDDPLSLTVARVGPFSASLYALRPGDALWIRGPLGQGFALRGERILLAGGGYGVAPLLLLARRAMADGIGVAACIGARTAEEVLLAESFEQLGAAVRITTEDGSRGMRGLITDAVQAEVATHRPDAVYACGPVHMLEAVDRLCEAHCLPRQLSWEAHMRCGIGLCGSCELPDPHRPDSRLSGVPHPGWLTCLDGPVSFMPDQDGESVTLASVDSS